MIYSDSTFTVTMDTSDAMSLFANLATMFESVKEIDESILEFWEAMGVELGVLKEIDEDEEE